MKYREEDLVRIRSKTWWEENKPKNFPEHIAKDCCGKIVEIMNIFNDNRDRDYNYGIKTPSGEWYFINESWVERELGKTIIPLKQLKSEI